MGSGDIQVMRSGVYEHERGRFFITEEAKTNIEYHLTTPLPLGRTLSISCYLEPESQLPNIKFSVAG
jgi:hypothetical protein